MQAKNETLSDFLEIGKRIRSLREHYRLTGKRLAEILNLQPVTLSRYENGRPIPSDVLARLCVEYPAISGDWLLTGRGDMMRSEVAPAVVKLEDYEALRDTVVSQAREIAELRGKQAPSLGPEMLSARAASIARQVDLLRDEGAQGRIWSTVLDMLHNASASRSERPPAIAKQPGGDAER